MRREAYAHVLDERPVQRCGAGGAERWDETRFHGAGNRLAHEHHDQAWTVSGDGDDDARVAGVDRWSKLAYWLRFRRGRAVVWTTPSFVPEESNIGCSPARRFVSRSSPASPARSASSPTSC